MGLTELIFQAPVNARIGSVTLDASVRETHMASAKVTRHPIESESGTPSNVSDHVLIDPLSVSIEGVVSGHPADFVAGIVLLFGSGSADPVLDAYHTMVGDLLTGTLVTIITTLHEYPNMVLEKVSVTRDAGKGSSLYFSAAATMVQLPTLETVEVAPDVSTKAGGKKPVKAATTTQTAQAQSAAAKAWDWW